MDFGEDGRVVARWSDFVGRRGGKEEEGDWDSLPLDTDDHSDEEEHLAVGEAERSIEKKDLVLVAVLPGRGAHLLGRDTDLDLLFDGLARLVVVDGVGELGFEVGRGQVAPSVEVLSNLSASVNPSEAVELSVQGQEVVWLQTEPPRGVRLGVIGVVLLGAAPHVVLLDEAGAVAGRRR